MLFGINETIVKTDSSCFEQKSILEPYGTLPRGCRCAPLLVTTMKTNEHYPETWLLTKVGWRRKALAFVTVALTTFLLLGMFWPLSTKGYSSQSEIQIGLAQRHDSAEKFKPVLSDVLERQTSIDSIIALMKSRGIGKQLDAHQQQELAKTVRKQLNVSLREIDDSHRFAIDINLRGTGSPREDYMVNLMATEMARDFMTSPLAALLPTDAMNKTNQIADLESRRLQIRDRADSLISQIEGNLESVKQNLSNVGQEDLLASNDSEFYFANEEPSSFDEMAKANINDTIRELINQRAQLSSEYSDFDPRVKAVQEQIEQARAELASINSQNEDTSSDSPFRSASFSKNKPASDNTSMNNDDVRSQLDQVDVRSLRDTINELAEVASEATMAAENGSGGPVFSVESVQRKTAAPIGGIPSQPQLLLLGFFSLFFAGLVATFFQPFTEKGFESAGEVSEKLGLPVLATIDSRYRYDETTGSGVIDKTALQDSPMSNQIVKTCEIALFVVCMLAIGFCLVNSDIRNAFWESPFHGFSRVVWMFRGN